MRLTSKRRHIYREAGAPKGRVGHLTPVEYVEILENRMKTPKPTVNNTVNDFFEKLSKS